MDNIIEFKRKTISKPLTTYDKYKDILRKYYTDDEVLYIVASLYDSDYYNEASDHIKKAVDLYHTHKIGYYK